MARRLFDIDFQGVQQVVEDLCEALDVVGFPKPLEKWEDEDSAARAWMRSLESKEADEILAEVEGMFKSMAGDIPKWAGANKVQAQEGLKLIAQAKTELAECCTYEDRD